MANIVLFHGNIGISDCFDQRHHLKKIGARWDKASSLWVFPMTSEIMDKILEVLGKDVFVTPEVVAALEKQIEKEDKLEKIYQQSKKDTPISFRVPGITKALYNYQKHGIRFALVNSDGVLFADEMGLGKSVESLGVACYKQVIDGFQDCLVVTPASLKFNWPIEIEKFTEQRYVVIDGDSDERMKLWSGRWESRLVNEVIVTKPCSQPPFFYVVNYELVMEDLFGGKDMKIRDTDDQEKIARKQKMMKKSQDRSARLAFARDRVWQIIIVDEIHYIKSHSAKRSELLKRLRSRFRIGLSGTPLDGKLEHLHSVMEFIKPGLFSNKTRFLQRHAEFDYWGKVKSYKRVQEVREKIKPFFIRRLKKDVLKDLPDKIYQNRFVELSPRERKEYDLLASKKHTITEDEMAMVAIIRCKQFCDHPAMIGLDLPSSKMAEFMSVVDELVNENAQKIVVFSQYAQMAMRIRDMLIDDGIKCLYIDNSVPAEDRARYQKKFNDDPSIDVIVGTDAMSTGLNFTGASYVINYDDVWAPTVMNQRADRCHRVGQKNVVNVINFVVRNTIEERIRKMLADKEKVTVEVLGDEIDDLVIRQINPQKVLALL